MSLRATLVLVVLLLGVGVAWYLMRDSDVADTANDNHDQDTVRLLADEPINLKRLIHIKIERPGQATIALEQHRGSWQMTQPARFSVDTSKVTNLTAILQALTILQSDAPITASPALMASLSLTDGEHTLLLTFGNRMGRGIGPIMIGEGQYVLTDDLAHEILERLEPNDLFLSALQTPSAFETLAVTIDSELGRVELHQENGRWYLGEGTMQRALSVPIAGYIDIPALLNIPRHSGAKVSFTVPFPAGPAQAYGLDHPRLTVTYTPVARGLDDTINVTVLTIGGPIIGREHAWFGTYGMPGDESPVVFSIPAEFSITMARDADAFRDPRIIETLPGDIEKITLMFEANAAEVDASGIHFLGDTETGERTESRDASLATFAQALTQARARGYLPLEVLEGKERLVAVTVTPRFGDHPEVFYIYEESLPISDTEADSTLLVLRDGETIVMQIQRPPLEPILRLAH